MQNSRKEIGEVVGRSQEEAKDKWNELRNRFVKPKKRMVKPRAGPIDHAEAFSVSSRSQRHAGHVKREL